MTRISGPLEIDEALGAEPASSVSGHADQLDGAVSAAATRSIRAFSWFASASGTAGRPAFALEPALARIRSRRLAWTVVGRSRPTVRRGRSCASILTRRIYGSLPERIDTASPLIDQFGHAVDSDGRTFILVRAQLHRSHAEAKYRSDTTRT
jgi:hypothetical protein